MATNTQVIDKDEALTLLEQVVSEHGADKVSDGSTYFEYINPDIGSAVNVSRPVCFIGHVAVKAGNNELTTLLGEFNSRRLVGIALDRILPLSVGALSVLQVAQDVQDGNERGAENRSWGTALEAARKVA